MMSQSAWKKLVKSLFHNSMTEQNNESFDFRLTWDLITPVNKPTRFYWDQLFYLNFKSMTNNQPQMKGA